MVKEPMGNRVVRVPATLWKVAKARADERGETLSDAIRRFLVRYTK